jgi:hypothetical protein
MPDMVSSCRSIFLGGLLLLAGMLPSFAALPPYYQRVRELQAILDDESIQAKLGGKPIDSITFIEQDHYEVLGGACLIEVQILDVPLVQGAPPILGPRKFTLSVGDPDCETGDQ